MQKSWKPYIIVLALFILVAGIILAIVLPLTLGHHTTRYCSDHEGWVAGQPLSKCRPPFTYIVPINSIPANYRLVSGGSTSTTTRPASNASNGKGSTSTSAGSAGRGGASASGVSGGRGRRMIRMKI